MPTINVFIISWVGQHENAIHIARQVSNVTDDVHIVFSDPDPTLELDAPCNTIRRPNNLYWGDKFQACIEATGDNPMLVIHADCTFEDWGELALRCASVVNERTMIGLWAPAIDYVQWSLDVVEIGRLDDSRLVVSSRTDGIVFYLAAPIVNRMRRADYANNIYGRGIEMMFTASTYARGLIAVVDTSLKVQHPKETGYDEDEAHAQLVKFIQQMDLQEKIQHILLNALGESRGVKWGVRPSDADHKPSVE